MARKYLLDPNETVRVVIFVDTRNGLVVHHAKDIFERITGSDPAAAYEPGQELPEGVYEEWAEFAKPSFSLQQEIEQDTIEYDDEGNVKVNIIKQSEMKLKYLLRDWSLSAEEPELKLVTVKDAKSRAHLTPDCMKMILNRVQPALVSGFLTAHAWHNQRRINKTEEETKKEVQAATGIKAPN